MATRPHEFRQLRWAGLLFVLSGAAALVYQVAWQRILALHGGVGLYSVTMIVAAFLAGLGLGSHVGGVASARLGRRAALRAFMWLEIAIAVSGALSPLVYYDWLYPLASPIPSPSWQAGLLHFVALLPPTALMGMSLPLLVRATVADVEGAGRVVGTLYGCNLLGAALGAAGGTWLLMPWLGIRGAVLAGAVANIGAGAGAWRMLKANDDLTEEGGAKPGAGVEAPGGRPLGLWLALYGLSGFTALSLEILWFRLVDVAVKSTAFTFGTVLGVYLLGNAVGCLLAAPRVARLRQPLRAFLLIQTALLAYAAAVVVALGLLPAGTAGVAWFDAYWAGYGFFALGHERDAEAMFRLYGVLPLVLFGPPTVLMGAAFPVLQRAVHDDPRASGRKVGYLQAVNILGCVAGSLLVGLVGLQALGTAGTLRGVMLAGQAFPVIGMWHYGRAFVWPSLALLVLTVFLPGQEALWRRLHGVAGRVSAYVLEDATGVVAVTPELGVGGRRWRLSINGKGNSWFPFGGVHTTLGAGPVAIHAAPEYIALIGLGSGDTAWAAGSSTHTRGLTVFELSAPQPSLLRQLNDADTLPDLRALLGDPRVRVVVADGRKALAAGTKRYDVIEADAVYPSAAYSGNLYSVEFFELGAGRLRPGGVMCTWAPTPRIRSSFCQVFDHVIALGDGDILIGSNRPIAWEPDEWQARLRGFRQRLGEARLAEVAASLSRAQRLVDCRVPVADVNRDLFPRDEFASR